MGNFNMIIHYLQYKIIKSCPNGMTCIYRHCLPPGYTLKKTMQRNDDDDVILLEDILEKERSLL